LNTSATFNAMSYQEFVSLIQQGEPVSPQTPNRALSQLQRNIERLAARLDELNWGQTLRFHNRPVATNAEVGHAVYLDREDNVFKLCQLGLKDSSVGAEVELADSSIIWGIVAKKLTPTSADILASGYADLDIRRAAGLAPNAPIPAGNWYLSGSSPGGLTAIPPDVAVIACTTDQFGKVYRLPGFNKTFQVKKLYSFKLAMYPSGNVIPPDEGEPHTITNANPSVRGWLPASHPIFNDLAPPDAKFGYNLAAHPELRDVFPPSRVAEARIIMQRPSVQDPAGRRWYGQQLFEDTVIIDVNGIWWMRNEYDNVPWPTTLDNVDPQIPIGPDDPALFFYNMRLKFTKYAVPSSQRLVRTLVSQDPRVEIVCQRGGQMADSGDLAVKLNLSLRNSETEYDGYKVLKGFDEETGLFSAGPVVSGIYSLSSNVQLVGDEKTLLTDGREIFRGQIGVKVQTDSQTDVPATIVKLLNAIEDSNPVLNLSLPSAYPSGYIAKFRVGDQQDSSTSMKIRFRIVGKSAGTLPPLLLSYTRVPKPESLNTAVNFPLITNIDLPINTTATVTPNQIVEAETNAFEVSNGDIIYLTVNRNPASPADSYGGNIGILDQRGILSITATQPLPATVTVPPVPQPLLDFEELYATGQITEVANLNFVYRDGLEWATANANSAATIAEFLLLPANMLRRRGWFYVLNAQFEPGRYYRLSHLINASPQFTDNTEPVSPSNPNGLNPLKPLQWLFQAITPKLIYLDINRPS
jgi:hypothetical protein